MSRHVKMASALAVQRPQHPLEVAGCTFSPAGDLPFFSGAVLAFRGTAPCQGPAVPVCGLLACVPWAGPLTLFDVIHEFT